MEDALLLKNVSNNIYGENIGMEFYMKHIVKIIKKFVDKIFGRMRCLRD